MNNRAWFVKFPSRIDDLRRPHPLEHRIPHAIVRTVILSRIEYRNFIEDFRVERRYLEKHSSRCRVEDGVLRCLFVRCRDRGGRVCSSCPTRGGFVVWAAYGTDVES